jgi:hypothetical protein
MFKRPLVLIITCLVFLLSGFKSKAQWSSEDSLKATNYIRYTAEVFEKLKHNQEVRKSILGIAESSADPVYFATIDRVIKNYDSKEINQQISLKDSINLYLSSLGYDIVYDSIVSFFNSKSYYARWYENEDNLSNGRADSALVTFAPYVTILNKPEFNNTSFLWDVIPLVGYFSFEDSLPISSTNPDLSITEEMIWLNEDPYFNWVFGFKFTPLLGAYTTGLITTCTGTVNPFTFPCVECEEFFPFNNLPYSSSGSNQNTEIAIILREQGTAASNCIFPISNVSSVTPVSSNLSDLNEYAILQSIRNLPKYTLVALNCTTPLIQGIKKVNYGIIDRFNVEDLVTGNFTARLGNQLTLCKSITKFISGYNQQCYSVPPNSGTRFYLEHGLFELKRGFMANSFFFYVPYASGIWYNGYPDMAINYNYEFNPISTAVCTNPPPSGTSIMHNMVLEDCAMCKVGIQSVGIGANNFLGNNDYKVIHDYWMDNVIDIGFMTSSTSTVTLYNLHRLYASNHPTPDCSVWSFEGDNNIMIQSLNLSFDGVYTTLAPINSSTYQLYPKGTVLGVEVNAKYKNGELVSERRCITLEDECGYITVQIRGDIKDFENGINNYDIKIYD